MTRSCLPQFLRVVLMFGLFLVLLGSAHKLPNKCQFAFWYEDWQERATMTKLAPANVIVGIAPQFIAEIHKNGGKALQYVTYYQSTFNTSLLKNQSDLKKVGFLNEGRYLLSAFGGENNYVLCPNSVELRRRVLADVETSLKQGYDGLFVDNAYLPPATDLACQSPHQHESPGVVGTQAYLNLLKEVRLQLKSSHPDSTLIVNTGSPAAADKLISGLDSVWNLSDYVVWESFGYSSYRKAEHDRWENTLHEAVKYSSTNSKGRKILALSFPLNSEEALYSYVIARIFGFSWTANLGDRDTDSDKEGGHFGAYFRHIPWQLGEPIGKPPTDVSPTLRRCFSAGEAYANTGPGAVSISAPGAGMVETGAGEKKIKANEKILLPSHTAAAFVFSKYHTCAL